MEAAAVCRARGRKPTISKACTGTGVAVAGIRTGVACAETGVAVAGVGARVAASRARDAAACMRAAAGCRSRERSSEVCRARKGAGGYRAGGEVKGPPPLQPRPPPLCHSLVLTPDLCVWTSGRWTSSQVDAPPGIIVHLFAYFTLPDFPDFAALSPDVCGVPPASCSVPPGGSDIAAPAPGLLPLQLPTHCAPDTPSPSPWSPIASSRSLPEAPEC
ncbi:UNVERIFIED_CONTAM: hypothetical protein FKN15_034879 [Acipenser sinensis]